MEGPTDLGGIVEPGIQVTPLRAPQQSALPAASRAPPPTSSSMQAALQQPSQPVSVAALTEEANLRGSSSPPDGPFRLGRALLLPPTAASWGDGGATGRAGDGDSSLDDGGGISSQRWLPHGGPLADLAVPGPA